MRVLALTRSYPNPYLSSYATYNQSHFQHLRELVDVDLLVPIPWFRKGFRTGFRGSALSNDVAYPTFWYPPRIMAADRWRFYYRSIRRAALSAPKPDVIYSLWVSPDGAACQHLGNEMGVPVVMKSGGSDIHSVDPAAREVTQRALRTADQLITVSKALGDDAIELGLPPKQLTVVYNGIDQQMFHIQDGAQARQRVGLPAEPFIFCCVARLHPVKNLGLMIDAFAQMQKKDCLLTLIGDGPERQALERQAISSGAGDRIRFVGETAYEEIPHWINASDAITLSSHNEGVPNTLIEALSCGRPVVSTRVGGIAEVVQPPEHGLLVPAGQVKEYANALDWVATQSWDRARLRQSISQYTWDQNAQNTMACFENVIEQFKRT
ncbi:MAG: glycosyltransferase [Lysobacterales bacterium]